MRKYCSLVAAVFGVIAADCLADASREDTLEWFRREMYGRAPVGRPADQKIGERTVAFGQGRFVLNVHCSLPEGADKDHPAPVFLFGDHFNAENSSTRTWEYPGVPTNSITGRGYAYVRINFNDVAPNAYFNEGSRSWDSGVHSLYGVGKDDGWGTISAWAWAFSRAMDWIETRPELNAKEVAVLGHSRGGKTALWAAAQDERFALGISSGSGTGGARLLGLELPEAEHITNMVWVGKGSIHFWFCPNFRKYAGQEASMPHDADDLIGLIAPRLAYVASGSEDRWAGPRGEFEAARRASRYWEKFGKKGLVAETFGPPGTVSHDGSIGYHLHKGPHQLRAYDWERFMDFADRHFHPVKKNVLFAVVIEKTASDDDRFSANDLKSHLEKILPGAEVVLCETGAVPAGAVRFEVGTSVAKGRALKTAGKLASGESAAVCDGKSVYIWGAGQKGTSNGVYVYLEDRLGCRWLTPWDEPVIPKRQALPMEPFADVNRPALTVRWIIGIDGGAQLRRNGMLFHYRNRLNSFLWPAYNNVDLPDGVEKLVPEMWCPNPMVHSLFLRLPPHDRGSVKGSFAAHPEWYSMDADGKRTDKMMVCFSNRGLRDELTRLMLADIDRHGGKGAFDLSYPDECSAPFCLCPDCKALVERYGTPGAPQFDYLKELGEKLLKERPGAYVHFLAYRKSTTQTPPNDAFGRFPANLIPVFAPIDDDLSKDFAHPNNAETLTDLRRWGDITDSLWMWYYPLPYGGECPPFLALGRLASDLKISVKAGLTGASFEHDVGVSSGWNFADLQTWLIAKLYEHPEKPTGRLITEFCRLYYGAAADDILAYIRDLENISRAHKARLAWNGCIFTALNAENLMRWHGLFERAEAKVSSDPTLLQRLRECRMGVDHYILKRYAKMTKAGFAVPPEVFYVRLTNTLERAYERRCPGKEKNAQARAIQYNPPKGGYERSLQRVKTAYRMAGIGSAPLPARFANIPEEDLQEVPNMGGSGGADLVDMADAAYGRANSDANDSNDPKGFLCGFWDSTNKRFGEQRRIQPEEVEEPDKFCFYRIGVISPSPSCYVFPGGSCRVRSQLDDCYSPGEPEYWELWLSLKFEGPRFKGSKAKENRVWYDRAVLVRAKKSDLKSEKEKSK